MAVESRFTELPTTSAATMDDIICAVQGYVSPSNLGLSVYETLGQVYNLFQSNIILFNAGNPNGFVAGNTYQFCWDTLNSILYICTASGTSSTAVWTRADINSGYATTATAAGTTTLTVLSPYWQFFTGSTTQTVVMPVTSTLAAGMTWSIVNNSSGAVTIESSGANTIATLAAGEVALITCILNSGTTASSWNAAISAVGGGVTSITGTAHQVIASASTGAVTLSTPQNIDTTSAPTFAALTLSSPLTQANGGTENATPLTNGQLWIGNTGNPPSRASLTAGTGISITGGAGSITISTVEAGIGWTTVSGTTQTAAVNNGYVTNNGAAVTVTLPTTFAVGDIVIIKGLGAGGWVLKAGTATTIRIGSSVTSSGGTLTSDNQYDTVKVSGLVANTTWSVDYAYSAGLTVA